VLFAQRVVDGLCGSLNLIHAGGCYIPTVNGVLRSGLYIGNQDRNF
jgi:hypothetical protein